MRIRAVVAYDGTDYSGFQRQANAPTVQAALEAALAQVTQEPLTVTAAGRTDAGVHAAGQVIAFDTAWRHEVDSLRRAMNAVLPADVAVLALERAAADFHPRYDARSRRYRYTIYNAPVRLPMTRRQSLHVVTPLDLGAMQQAAGVLIGEHDFATFGQPTQGDVTVRRVLVAEWRSEVIGAGSALPRAGDGTHGRDPRTGDGTWLHFDIEANAFLYRMVRSIVGTLLQVGRGTLSVEGVEAALAARDRDRAGPTAPPHGLCLVQVSYD